MKDQRLWACHLGPELGGQGYGQLKLGLMNEKLGRNGLAPTVFGCQAPDTGNAEIIAHYGTDAQKEKYLWPLLNGEIRSAFSMTEPTGGSDPLTFKTRAVLDGDEWVINGEKWFSTNARVLEGPGALCGHRSGRQGPLPAHLDLPGAHRHARASRSSATSASAAAARSAAGPRATSATTTCACPTTPCWASAARPSSSPRSASAAGACTTPCARSAPARTRST